MKRRLRLLLLAVVLFFPLRVASAHPIPLPLPKSDFPPHTVQLRAGTFANHNYDCNWGAICLPVGAVGTLHSYPSGCAADDVHFFQAKPDNPATCLGRIGGWIEGGVVAPYTPKAVSWAIVGSTYDNETDTAGAALDFVQTAQFQAADMKMAKGQPNMLPGSDLGGSTVLVYKTDIPGGINCYVTLAFDGTAEIEAGADWSSGGHTQMKALRWLITLTEKALVYQLAHPVSKS